MKKKLSILIPTYNRYQYLETCLNSIFSQIDDTNKDKIEIIVSNNASTDNTIEIMKKYGSYEEISYKYTTNKINLGPDGNFYKLYCMSKGEYCWILGDDEVLLDGSLNYILELIEMYNNKIGLIYLRNIEKKEKINVSINQNKFLDEINFHITFISAVIFKKDEFYKLNYEEARNSYLIQLYFYFNTLFKYDINIIIYKKMFFSKMATTGGYKLFSVFSNNFNEILLKFISKGLKIETINKINKEMCINFFPNGIINIKNKENKYEKEDILKTLLTYEKKYFYFWLFCYPLIKLPNFLGKIYYFLIRCYRKILRN